MDFFGEYLRLSVTEPGLSREHAEMEHQDQPNFTLQAIRKARSALCRQVSEAVSISSFVGHTILNNKSNRVA